MIARKLKINTFLYFIFFHCILFGQNAQYKAEINASYHYGYQKIKLSPEVRALSNDDLSDIRIWDPSNKQVPYFIIQSKPISKSESKKTVFSNVKRFKLPFESQFIISNSESKQIDHFVLNITNTDVSKFYSIYGSENEKNWYSISSRQPMGSMSNAQSTNFEYVMYLPKTKYKYYKLSLNDSFAAPIVINEISIYNQSTWIESEKVKLTNFSQSMKKIGNDNLIQFNSKYRFHIDELKINLLNKGLYQRDFSISTIQQIRKSKQDIEIYQNQLNEKTNVFSGINTTDTQLKIRIYNRDNQPLTIQSIDYYQYPIYLVAYLDSNTKYTITTGDKNLKSPIYDIENYRDSLSLQLPQADIHQVEKLKTDTEIFSKSHFYQQKWFMWSCLGLGVLVIFYISIAIINSMNKKED